MLENDEAFTNRGLHLLRGESTANERYNLEVLSADTSSDDRTSRQREKEDVYRAEVRRREALAQKRLAASQKKSEKAAAVDCGNYSYVDGKFVRIDKPAGYKVDQVKIRKLIDQGLKNNDRNCLALLLESHSLKGFKVRS